MAEIDLMVNYPQVKRDVNARGAEKSDEDRNIARQFDQRFFDGERRHGYGGFNYHPRFWENAIPDFVKQYGLTSKSSVLDVGCAKGFMLYDMQRLIPGIQVQGIDISEYAIEHAYPAVRDFVEVGDAKKLPYADNSFDLVISVNTVHNLVLDECKLALQEIQRVSKQYAFITVDAYRNEAEQQRMGSWNLTALTYMHVDEWKTLFKEVGYPGDYYWFIP
jgi:SAM-dependent methyltransferase